MKQAHLRKERKLPEVIVSLERMFQQVDNWGQDPEDSRFGDLSELVVENLKWVLEESFEWEARHKTGCDVIPPKVSFYGVKSGDTFKGTREIKLTAQDNSGKPPIVSVSVDKNLKLIKNNPPYNYAWDTTTYDDGKHVVEAWGYDEAGNRGDAGSVDVMVKNGKKAAATTAAPAPVQKSVENPPAAVQAKQVSEPAVPSISTQKKAAPARSTNAEPKLQASLSGVATSTIADKDATFTGPMIVRPADEAPKAAEVPTTKPAAVVEKPAPTTQKPAAVDMALANPKVEGFSASVQDDRDPLTIPATRTSPNFKISADMMAMRSSSATYESPMAESSPTKPQMPSVTPRIASIRSATAELKGLKSGIESGVKTMHPVTGSGVMIAMAPMGKGKPAVTASPSQMKTMPKVIKGTVKLVMGDQKVALSSANGKDSIPAAALRHIMEELGALVVWDQETKTITAYNKGVRITMKVGMARAEVNGKKISMRAPVTIKEDHAMVDVKFLEKTLKMELEYDPQTGAFTLKKK